MVALLERQYTVNYQEFIKKHIKVLTKNLCNCFFFLFVNFKEIFHFLICYLSLSQRVNNRAHSENWTY